MESLNKVNPLEIKVIVIMQPCVAQVWETGPQAGSNFLTVALKVFPWQLLIWGFLLQAPS